MIFGDSSKPSSDTSESGKETPSPREETNAQKLPGSIKQSLRDDKAVFSEENEANEVNVENRDDFAKDSLSIEEDVQRSVEYKSEDSGGSSEEGNKSLEYNELTSNKLSPELPPQKGHSGLSKSALERVKKRRMEEIRKRELSLIKQKEKEIEERLKAEMEAKEAEEKKKAESNRRMAEMKRLEELIKAEELKKQKEIAEKKRIEEENNQKRREEELKVPILMIFMKFSQNL